MVSDSYARHELEEQSYAESDDLPWCYKQPNSVGHWHHSRMLKSIRPLLNYSSGMTWMTVGDGRFGSDANYLRSHGQSVTATSISASTLKIAQKRGWIDQFSKENGEALSFPDDSFDYVLCKETYHHFPRPAIALYEMLRVARRAVVLIEPIDGTWSPFHTFKRTVKKMLRWKDTYDQFEPSGNFIYRVNIEEIAKSLTALGLPAVSWKSFNTFWYAPFDPVDYNLLSFAKVSSHLAILAQDVACHLRLLSPGLATVICFKTDPDSTLVAALGADRFRMRRLPVNPYI